MANARTLLHKIFFEATAADDDLKPTYEEPKKGKEEQELSVTQSTLQDKLSELTKLLSSIGIEDVKNRLSIDRGVFRLTGNLQQHKKDGDILTDFSKITDLVDKDYVVTDSCNCGAEFDFIIICANAIEDLEIPDADDPKATDIDIGAETK